MAMTTDVLIAIQARSNSTRFPKKIYEYIGEKRVLDHVIDNAKSAADHVNKYTKHMSLRCQVAVLHPEDDELLVNAFKSTGAIMIAGNEKNVLSRYLYAQKITQADYVVRLTSDCPLMLDFVISKHIHTAAFYKHDYVSNVDEKCRFIADGFDCEVLSKRALTWLDENAKSDHDKEHVTTLLRETRPKHLSMACVTMKIDTSHMKMSVDTPEDLERIRAYYHEREKKIALAKSIYGMKLYDL